jgi:formylglycine-generating enzyme required for sulfatase activity
VAIPEDRANPGFAQTSDDPVTLVTYDDAMAFGAWVSQRARRKIGLPTEAQWEYAARAGTTTPYFAGSKEEDELASGWFKKNAGDGTRPVGQKPPNAFGLYDMGGNVSEWCEDVYSSSYYRESPALDPQGPPNSGQDVKRVIRGGSWKSSPDACRVTFAKCSMSAETPTVTPDRCPGLAHSSHKRGQKKAWGPFARSSNSLRSRCEESEFTPR